MKRKASDIDLEGKSLAAMVELYFETCKLKHLYRQGWLQHGIPEKLCESVADHSFATALLAMFLTDLHFPHLDKLKVLRLALLHDLGEIDAGDITPADKIAKADKSQLERQCVQRVLGPLFGDSYQELWEEYDAGKSPEASFVRQVEKLEMALQSAVYANLGQAELSGFLASAAREVEEFHLKQILASCFKIT